MRLQVVWLAFLMFLFACSPLKGELQGGTTTFDEEMGFLVATASPTVIPLLQVTVEGRVRPSAIAGSWYPDDPNQLAEMVDGFLGQASLIDGQPIGLIVPHAGYIYSGPVAAYGFVQMLGGDYETAVIIAADHQMPLSNPISVWAEGGFETPLGIVPVDAGLARAIIAADPQRISYDALAHEGEHPLEIELPFLQRVCPLCKIVPILMGAEDDETVASLANALLKTLPGKRVVIIASSDLSHYPRYNDAVRVDGRLLSEIETGEGNRVRAVIKEMMSEGIPNLATCACGEAPILVTMRVAQGLGANTITVLKYANSGDSPAGQADQVVGYGAVMLWKYLAPELNESQKQELLNLARTTIADYLKTGKISAYQSDDPSLRRLSGVFVTLREGGELRGCIGHMLADKPLYRAVQEMAVAAATSDPRFPPLTESELEKVSMEISILSPMHRITDVNQIEIGVHGLMISKGGHTGVFLPQVPVEQGWNLNDYLTNLCRKAGLPNECWKEDAALYTFTALVFGEP